MLWNLAKGCTVKHTGHHCKSAIGSIMARSHLANLIPEFMESCCNIPFKRSSGRGASPSQDGIWFRFPPSLFAMTEGFLDTLLCFHYRLGKFSLLYACHNIFFQAFVSALDFCVFLYVILVLQALHFVSEGAQEFPLWHYKEQLKLFCFTL